MASPETVLDVMQANCLQVSEFAKVKALVRWGRAQVLQSGEHEDGSSVRHKIEQYLNYVRFFDLEHQEFAQLCCTVVHDVLSAEEKNRIFESICLADPELMPLQFRAAGVKVDLHPAFMFALPYKEHHLIKHVTIYPLKSELQFEVDRKVQLVGLQHVPSVAVSVVKKNFDSFCFQVRETVSRDCPAGGTSAHKLLSNGSEFFSVSPKCILEPDTNYTIDVFYSKMVSTSAYYKNFALESGKETLTDNGLTLKLYSGFVNANVTQLVFKLA